MSSILCPNCQKLISDYVEVCPHCNLKNPAKKQRALRLIGGAHKSFVKTIITLNVILFIASYLLPLFIRGDFPSGRGMFGLLPSPSWKSLYLLGWADIRLLSSGYWWVLITATFLHGGVLHVLFNMLWVRDLAPQTEILFSPYKMLIVYILSGVCGNLVAVFTPLLGQFIPMIDTRFVPVIGASGAVFGLMGAIVAFGRKRGGVFGRQLVRQLGMWAVILIGMGFVFPGVSNAAHIGGFISGFLIGLLLPLNDTALSRGVFSILGTGLIGVCLLSFVLMVSRIISLV